MSYQDAYPAEKTPNNLHEAKAVQRTQDRPGWFKLQICCLGQRLARALVAAGKRLDRAAVVAASPDGEMG